MDLKLNKIETEIENLIKAKIKEKGLVSTGKMLNSIKVKASNGGFKVVGVDYFEYVNNEYHITDEVFNSKEFIDLLMNEATEQIGNDLFKELE